MVIAGVVFFLALMFLAAKKFIHLFKEEVAYDAVVESIKIVRQQYSKNIGITYSLKNPENRRIRPVNFQAAHNKFKERPQLKHC